MARTLRKICCAWVTGCDIAAPLTGMRLPLDVREFVRLAVGMVAVGLALGVMHARQWPPVVALASAVSDTYYRFGPKSPHPDVVFVAVDHAAVKQFGRWPWSRQQVAAGIDQLQRARVIALDMVFSESTSPAQDAALGQALARTTNVGGVLLNGGHATRAGRAELDPLANSAYTDIQGQALVETRTAELSIPPIAGAHTLMGSLNTLPDVDERFRHYPAGFALSGLALPTLGVQTLLVHLNEPARLNVRGASGELLLGGHRTALDGRGFTRLNFYPEASFKTLSFADLFSAEFDPGSVIGKIVILGVTEAGISDIRATPLGQYPGPLMHATFMSNVLQGHGLRELGAYQMALALALGILATLAAVLMSRLTWRLIFYPVLIGGVWVVGLGLYLHGGVWLESAYVMAGVLVSAMIVETSLLSHAKRHTEKLRHAFTSYLPQGLVSRIVEDPDKLKLGGEKKAITVLFSDIRGFTSMSEHIQPEKLADVMARYLQPMTEAVFAQQGTLDKYIGDAVMALFNAPLDLPDHEMAACRAAVAMQYAQLRINDDLATLGVKPLRTGIGINAGPAIVGNLGSTIRFNYTAIGDAVNLASRLESATKKLGVDVALGESVYLAVRDRLPCRVLGQVDVPGKEQPQNVYELCWRQVPDPLTGNLLEPGQRQAAR